MLESFSESDIAHRQRDEDNNTKDSLQNMFASSIVEEPSEDYFKVSPDSKMIDRNVEYEAESLDNARTLFFAVYCLLSDSKSIQNFWKDNQMGTLDLVMAAITTDAAIDLVRRI